MKIVFIKNNDALFNTVLSIRNTVFELEQGAIANEEIDLYDSANTTLYALVFDNNNAIATGRLVLTDNGFKIGRIAVLQAYRKKGVGKLLVNALIDCATQMGAQYILVDAQLHAVPFYKKLGFTPSASDTIIDRGIEHLPMRR